MNFYKLLLLTLALLVSCLFVEARQRASKNEDRGFKTGMDRLDLLGRAKRFVPLKMDLIQAERKKRDTEPFDFEEEGDKHRSYGIV